MNRSGISFLALLIASGAEAALAPAVRDGKCPREGAGWVVSSLSRPYSIDYLDCEDDPSHHRIELWSARRLLDTLDVTLEEGEVLVGGVGHHTDGCSKSPDQGFLDSVIAVASTSEGVVPWRECDQLMTSVKRLWEIDEETGTLREIDPAGFSCAFANDEGCGPPGG